MKLKKLFGIKLTKKKKTFLKVSLIIFPILLVVSFLIIFYWVIDKMDDRIYPNVTAFDEKIGGLTYDEARSKIYEKKEYIENRKIIIERKSESTDLSLKQLGVSVDLDKMIKQAYEQGRKSTWLKNEIVVLENFLFGYEVPEYFDVDEKVLNEYVKQNLENTPESPLSSEIIYKDGGFIVTKSKVGYGIDMTLFASEIVECIKDSDKQKIKIATEIEKNPDVVEKEALKVKDEANQVLSSTIKLIAGEKNWIIDKDSVAQIIDFKKVQNIGYKKYINQEKESSNVFFYTYANLSGITPDLYLGNYEMKVDINREKARDYLIQVSPGIEQPPINAVLAYENDQIVVQEASHSRITLDVDNSIDLLREGIINKKDFIELAINKEPAPISKETIDDLGIRTLIGTGKSNFRGSPKNRKHNITVGASKFNSILIPPGDVFSFLDILGPVDASTGYLPELVIKNNKTIPEYGGGMCQVSTTAFRGAINSGLEIVERRNHAYPVQYYAPQGTDATVYIPSPDLKFKNNTPGYVLIQTKVDGNELYFEYYGTDDGRRVETLGPFTYDRKSDGSMKAKWTQQVYKSDGTLWFEETFLSKYNSPNRYPHPGDEPKKEDD